MTDPSVARVETVGPVPARRTLPWAGLLDQETAAREFSHIAGRPDVRITGCRIEHIRYTPDTGCVISYTADYTVGGSTDRFSARLYARAFDDRAYLKAVQSLSARPWVAGALLPAPAALPDHGAILYEFPNDARLPHLAAIAQPARLMGIMQRIAADSMPGSTVSQHRFDLRLLRYKPESRCVLTCSVDRDPKGEAPGTALAVVFRTAKGRRSQATHHNLTRLYSRLSKDTPLRLPRPLYFDPTLQLAAVEWIEGTKLSDLWSGDGRDDAMRQTGRALARLHALDLPGLEPQGESRRDRRIDSALALLSSSSPTVASRIERLRELFRRAATAGKSRREGLIHGDFHQGQVLLREGVAWFIDFDGLQPGEIEQDVGNFEAQLQWLQLRGRLSEAEQIAAHLREGYQEEAHMSPDEQRLRFWCAAGLTELAAKQYRRLRADWPTTVPLLLSAAEARLGGA